MRYNHRNQNLELDAVYERNDLEIDGEEFFLEPLDAAYKRSKGGNSCLFRLVSAADPDIQLAIKFCRFPAESLGRDAKRVERFEREVKALFDCKNSDLLESVVNIETSGELRVASNLTLPYFVMELAEADLTTYLEDQALSLPQKLALCKRILDSLQQLHEIGIYHRDIKPDNILLINGYWKLADLGLINYREEDLGVDSPKDKIGPFGYHSPEAVNFGLNLRKQEEDGFFCKIDEKSDIYQLGLVFWYIFQQELPTGQVVPTDLTDLPSDRLFEKLLCRMLQYCKRRRASTTELQEQLLPLMREWGLT